MQVKLIGRGKSGWHAHGLSDGNKCSSTGGTLEGYLAEAEDGTPIYDAEQAEMGAFSRFVITGPLEDCSLAPGEVKKFSEHKTLAMMVPAMGGVFKTIAAHALAGISSMDYVSTEVWLAMLKERVSGVKFGTVRNHAVVWES
jgi:hypothetical protein